MRAALAAVLGVAALGLPGAVANAAGNADGPTFSPGELVGTLHRVNQMEIEAGKLAERRAGTRAVKNYGATLRHDHCVAEERLRRYSSARRLALDTAPPREIGSQLDWARDELDNLEALGGEAFDREFAEMTTRDQQRALALVESARGGTTDPRLKAILDDLEPTLREQVQRAVNLVRDIDDAAGALPRPPTMDH